MLYGAMNFPVRPLLEEVEAVARLGFDYLEIAMDPPRAHHGVLKQMEEDLIKALDRFNLGVICHLPTFISTADLTEGLREASLKEMISSLEVAARLQTLKVVLHPSYVAGLGGFVMGEVKENAMKSLEVIVGKAHELGLCLCMENMFPRGHWLVKPEDFAEPFEKFPSLYLTLDTGHGHVADPTGQTTLAFIQKFPGRIGHVHANDNFGKEDIHLPIGAGTIDFPAIVKALKRSGYNDTVTLEVFSRDRDYVKISREKIAAMFGKE
jgi:sugar phosphate isomerase/epimerase